MYEIKKLLMTGMMACLCLLKPVGVFAQSGISGNPVPQSGVTFKTTDLKLQKLYDEAEKKARWNIVKNFGKYQVLVEGAEYKNVWLETQPMGGYMYGKRNLEIARNNILIFTDFQREDGRLPGMLSWKNNQIIAHYGWFQGYCFPMPAFELYYWLGKDRDYLEKLYTSLEKFDGYLWRTRDSDNNGCLETWCVWDTGEDNCTRLGSSPHAWTLDLAPTEEQIKRMTIEELKACCQKTDFDFSNFPVPIESMDIMSYAYSGRDVLARISKELGNGKEEYWREKANEVRSKIKGYLWNEEKHACYDRDKNNQTMDILIHNNLRCMYYGSFDQHMADDFIRYHLLNPNEFWTPMPLPSIAVNDPAFRNISGNNWSGQPEGLTFQRSIRALENYGHFAELTLIGQRFLKSVADSLKFTQQFDPFTAAITKNMDGYGPTILTSLEFISRLYGIHLTEDKVYWSCLDKDHDFEYIQQLGDQIFTLKTDKDRVFCSVNGREVCSFTKGTRIITDRNGKLFQLAGIEPNEKNVTVEYHGEKYHVVAEPNTLYDFHKRFKKAQSVDFSVPADL